MWALVLVEFVTSVRKESAPKLCKSRAEDGGVGIEDAHGE